MKTSQVLLSIKFSRFSFEECFKIAKDGGFDGIEYFASYNNLFLSPESILNLSDKYTIPVLSIHSPLQLVFYTPTFYFQPQLKITKFFPRAKTYIMHLSSFITPISKGLEKLQKFVALAKKTGLIVCFESSPIFPILKWYPQETLDPHKFGNFCLENNLEIVLDTSHIASVGGDIIEFYKRYKSNIHIIHLSDFDKGVEHLPLGKGSLPLKSFLSEVNKSKKFPTIVLEIGNLGKKERSEQIKDIKNSIAMVRTNSARKVV